MKKVLLIGMILLLTGCTNGIRQDHISYYIDGEEETECECNCETEIEEYKDTLNKIEEELRYYTYEPEEYSKKEIVEAVEKAYDLAK